MPQQTNAFKGAAPVARPRVASKMSVAKLWSRYGIFFILAVFVVGLSIASPTFLTPLNLANLGGQISVLGLISLGVLLTVVTGNVDLTVGAMLSLLGAVIAMAGLASGAFAAILAGLVTAAAVGLFNGYLSTRGRNLSVIVTLAMMTAIQGITLLMTDGSPVYGFPDSLNWLGAADVLGGVPVSFVALVVVALVVGWFLSSTVWGRELFAVGGNPEAARLAGIPVARRVKLAFLLSSLLAFLAGLILIGRVASAQPTAGLGMELNAVGAVLIGGASLNGGSGRVANTMAGVAILGLITNGINLLNINGFFAFVVTGAVILIAILLNQWEGGRR
jgi:ribose/xylose/arabinose/galactoside ABC-type transport system permease subunit